MARGSRTALVLEHLPADVQGLEPLLREALCGRPVAGIVSGREAIERHAAAEVDPAGLREAIARWMGELARLEPPVAAVDALRSLAVTGARAVVAVVRSGFLGGSLDGVLRAVHAVRLARHLAAVSGSPRVPVLLNLSDDEVLPEVSVVGEGLGLQRLALPRSVRRPGRPACENEPAASPDELAALRAHVASSLWDGPEKAAAMELFFPSRSLDLGSEFSRSFLELLGGVGLVVLEPRWLRKDLSRSLAALVGRARRPSGTPDIGISNRSQNHFTGTPIAYFRAPKTSSAEIGWQPARAEEDGIRFPGEPGSRTAAELAAEILQAPEQWAPGPGTTLPAWGGVLPVAAFVGGSDDLLAWVDARRCWGEAAPAIPFVPALRATLVEPECARSAERVGTPLRDLLAATGEPAGSDRAPLAAERLRLAAERAAADLLGVRPDVAGVDEGLAAQLKRLVHQVRGAVEGFAGRVERAARNRAAKSDRHERRLRSSLTPGGRPQQEVLGAVGFIARHGREWLEELVSEIDPFPTEHVLVRLPADPGGAGR